jgi:hypothetical protein
MAITSLFWLCACSSNVAKSSLVGDYEAKYDFGAETLRLQSNGTYTQRLVLKNGKNAISHSGRWEYAQPRNLVILHDPLMFDDNFGKLNPQYRTPADGSWNLNVRSGLTSLALAWNDDVGVTLRKID